MEEPSSPRNQGERREQRRNEYCVPGNTNPPKALPAQPEGFAYTPQVAPDVPYVIFVHGFNVQDWEKPRFAQTAYKRLWWSGYKGRFGEYDWPCSLSALDFDKSEYNAWLSGTGLKDLLVRENGNHLAAGVYLLAHSQGNIVAGEALREAGLDTSAPRPLVKVYIASQAAISASYYQADVPRYKERIPERGAYDNDDVMGHYPHGYASELPYLEPARQMAAKWVNFYNPADWAMGDDVTTLQKYWVLDWWLYDHPGLNAFVTEICNKLSERRESVFELDNDLFRGRLDVAGRYQYVWSEHLFRLNECVTIPDPYGGPSVITCHPTGQALDVDDVGQRFKMFSSYAQFLGIPLGATAQTVGPFRAEDSFNLQAPPLEYTDDHIYHSGELRGTYSRHQGYWEKVVALLSQ